MRAESSDKIVEGGVDRRRIRFLPAEPRRLREHLLIKHKIRTFHTHSVQTTPRTGKRQIEELKARVRALEEPRSGARAVHARSVQQASRRNTVGIDLLPAQACKLGGRAGGKIRLSTTAPLVELKR